MKAIIKNQEQENARIILELRESGGSLEWHELATGLATGVRGANKNEAEENARAAWAGWNFELIEEEEKMNDKPQFKLPANITARLEGTSYCPDAQDYQLLEDAVYELQNSLEGTHLDEDYSGMIRDEMQRLLTLRGGYQLSDRLSVVVSVEAQND